MGCFTWLAIIVLAVFVMITLLRWFEQTAEAVDQRWWNKVFVLLAMPFTVWFFPSQVSAGRPSPVPLHEPVRGFGSLPKQPPQPRTGGPPSEQAPPGTPVEFLGKPKIPPKPTGKRPPVDPEQIARLRQKMREQGMLEDED